MSADGREPPARITTTDDGAAHFPTSLVGETLLFNRVKSGDHDIWVYTLQDKKSRPVLAGPSFHTNGALSPDGQLIAYMSNETGGMRVSVMPFSNMERAKPVPVSPLGYAYPVWSPGGGELYYSQMALATSSPNATAAFGVARILDNGSTLTVSGEAPQVPGTTRPNISSRAPSLMWDRPGYDVARDGRLVWGANLAVPALGNQLRLVFNWFEELKQRARPD
jgi:hypothetical protein